MRSRRHQFVSRRYVMQVARGYYPGRVRSYVDTARDPLGIVRLLCVECDGNVVASGFTWDEVLANLRANLPKTDSRQTDWPALDAMRASK